MWTDSVINFSGRHFNVKDAISFPKPKEPIPIWVGGSSDAAIRRAASLGDGWHPIAVPAEKVKEGRAVIEKSGRKVTISMRSMVSITSDGSASQPGLSGTRQQVVKQIEDYRLAGVEYFLLQSGANDVEAVAGDIAVLARDILSSF
jgi:alkanesulfonate monooxygenase SsuD/methylene tetrahydromethanopterin reductase-like flavin-dependent oxidoreductase (luciferase family)